MKSTSLAAFAALALAATPAAAQNTAAPAADPYATTAPAEEDDEFPWGLLGLLGLAGLLGLKRRDRDDYPRSTTGTGTTDRR